jgi:UDP-glucose 4-epimerase
MILILGSGFVGTSVARRLCRQSMPVKVFSRTPPGLPAVPFRQGLWRDIEQHADFFAGVDTIVHTISTTVPYSSMQDRRRDIADNIETNVRVLDIAVSRGVRNILFISSGGAVYGHPEAPVVDETHPTNPISSYGVTKLATEKYLRVYSASYGIDTLALRPSNLYGTGQRTHQPQGVVAHLVKALLSGAPFTVWGDGEGRKDYLHIDDFVEAVAMVLQQPFPKQKELNVCFDESYTVNHLIELAQALSGRTLAVAYAPAKSFDVPGISLSSARLRQCYPWAPAVGLEEGIRRTIRESMP